MLEFDIDPNIERIIKKHQHRLPVDVLGIARDLKLIVYVGPSGDSSGRIVKNKEKGGESGYAIYVNEKHPKNRQRFTIAHELAHFILHKDLIGDGIVDNALYRSGLNSKVETEANRLAAEILMPLHLIVDAWDDAVDTVSDLAKKFHVSETAMAIRLGVPF